MEEIQLLLWNIGAICYESALKEYLQRRWISCWIRRVFSCCCSRHLIAGSANALRKLIRGVAAALGGKEEERRRTKNDGNKIPDKRGTSSRMSSRQTVFSSSEKNSTRLRRRELCVLWLSLLFLSFSLQLLRWYFFIKLLILSSSCKIQVLSGAFISRWLANRGCLFICVFSVVVWSFFFRWTQTKRTRFMN